MTTARRRPTAKRATATSGTRRRSTAGRSTGRRSTTRRRSTRRTSPAYRRRTRPKVATTVGAALGTLVVAFLLDASWPVRVGLVALALLLAGGYLLLQGRRSGAEPADEVPAPSPTTPPTTPPTSTPPTTDTPEDPTA